ncbi:MAG: MFS transporter [Chloroflexi bacterium]|nr:MFS transporter [Chloroflexota bacterium]
MLLVAAWGVFLAGPAQTYGVSVFVDPMLTTFGWSRSLISTAYAVATLVGAGGVILTGRLLDRYGHRKVLSGAALGFGLAMVVMGAVAEPLTLTLGLSLLRGFGIGALLLGSRTLASQWYVRRRGRALSLVAVGGALSLASVPAANGWLIGQFGWRVAWWLDALVVWLLFLPLVAWLVRDRPEQVGQVPDGMPSPLRTSGDSDGTEPAWHPRAAMRTRPFWLLLGASMVPGLVITGLDFNLVSILSERSLAPGTAALVFTASSIVTLPASLTSGYLVDRLPSRYVLAVGQLLLAIALAWLLFADSLVQAIFYGVLRGLMLGLWEVALDATWPTYFGRRHLGGIRGVTFGAEVVGAAIGPLPFGLIYDLLGGYSTVLAGVTLLPVAATVAVLLSFPPGIPTLQRRVDHANHGRGPAAEG